MANRQVWQDLYAVSTTTSALALAVTADPGFNATANKGIRGTGSTAKGVFTMLLTEHPDLKAPTSTVENALTHGKPIRKTIEYNQVIAQAAIATLPMLANAYNLSLFLSLLFQPDDANNGASEVVGTTNATLHVLTCKPYDQSDVTLTTYIVKVMSDTSETLDQVMKGSICNQLTVNAEEGGLVTLSAEMIAAKWDQYDASAALTVLKSTFDDTTPLKWQDATVKIAGQTVDSKGFSMVLNNNVYFSFYNNNVVKNIFLGPLTATGTIRIPWSDASSEGKNKQLIDFISGIDKTISIYWGAAVGADTLTPKGGGTDTKNYFSIQMNIILTDYSITGDNEVMIEANWAAVQDATDTSATITINCGYDKAELDRI